MTPEQISTSHYVIEYRNPDGSLLLPQFGGCWHDTDPPLDVLRRGSFIDAHYWCHKCKEPFIPSVQNLFTPNGFFDLWEAMQAREDWDKFIYGLGGDFASTLAESINPLTFPQTVVAYLKGLER